ncbi:MAG: glycosyltransferase [Spirochaetia bacterium]|nr:glycosyltransferase [Spirochaetia bacterium]MCF7940749.1 glycosyltransferase [Spirochaetia bacterium]
MAATPVEVSIIIPCYNGMRTVTECLRSLLSLDPQSPSHEIIVVDNGSTDGSVEVIKAFKQVKLLYEHDIQGPAAARNTGVRGSQGAILAFIDIDCIATPGWLIESVAAFEDPEVVGAGGRIEGSVPKNEIQVWMNTMKILDQERAVHHPFMPYLQTANALFRREAFLLVEGFDTGLICGEDCDLSWRIQKMTGGRIAYCPQALVYHDHRASMKGVYRQSRNNAMAGALLSRKWEGVLPKKSWKTSVWECWDLLLSGLHLIASYLTFRSRSRRFGLRLDFLHRFARKEGMIRSAIKTRQWSQW